MFAPLDFCLHAGEMALIEGDNGSGKSTLLRMLAGLLHVSEGALFWRDQPLQRDRCAGEILFMGHQLGQKADLSPRENLRHVTGLNGQCSSADVNESLIDVGLHGYEDEPLRRLSAGQKKRAALARLLLSPACLWLLDEPYSNLDRVGIALVNRLLENHVAGGGAALVTSHGAVGFHGASHAGSTCMADSLAQIACPVRPRLSLATACNAMLRRDLTLAWRRRGDIALPVLYALIVTMLFPFALGPEDTLLQRIAGGVILVTVLLSMLLALDAMFASDIEDGSLEQLVMAPQPLALMLGMKILAHWLTTALPLIVIAPLLAAMLHLPAPVIPVLLLALLLSTPLLSLLGAILVALTAGTRRSGMLLALMLLPLCVPAVIFAAGAVAAAQQGLPWQAPLVWLAAALVLALVLAPLACATALRIALDS